jgi:hypothetical protein
MKNPKKSSAKTQVYQPKVFRIRQQTTEGNFVDVPIEARSQSDEDAIKEINSIDFTCQKQAKVYCVSYEELSEKGEEPTVQDEADEDGLDGYQELAEHVLNLLSKKDQHSFKKILKKVKKAHGDENVQLVLDSLDHDERESFLEFERKLHLCQSRKKK